MLAIYWKRWPELEHLKFQAEGIQYLLAQVSSDHNPDYLMYIADSTTQSYKDHYKPLNIIRIPIDKPINTSERQIWALNAAQVFAEGRWCILNDSFEVYVYLFWRLLLTIDCVWVGYSHNNSIGMRHMAGQSAVKIMCCSHCRMWRWGPNLIE